MTFEEAGARFAQLQAQYRSGMIQPAQFQQMVAQLAVQDPAGRYWQLEANSGQWMVWNGTQWSWPQQAAAPVQQPAVAYPAQAPQYPQQSMQYPGQQPMPAQYAVQPAPQATLTVQGKKAGPPIWEGLAPVVPGFVIGLAQNWPAYSKSPADMAGFAIPSLLPAILVPLVPYIGRVVAIIIVLGCLVWLSWPVVSNLSAILGNAKAVQSHAGRGLVGVSLIYLLPRIWKTK
jgi:hypothetical protein